MRKGGRRSENVHYQETPLVVIERKEKIEEILEENKKEKNLKRPRHFRTSD